MAKKKLGCFFVSLIIIIALIIIIPVGGYLILRFGLNIDLIAYNKQIKLLAEEFDKSALISQYTEDDKDSLIIKLNNAGLSSVINGDINNLFLVAKDNTNGVILTSDIVLNDNELACLASSYLNYLMSETKEDNQAGDEFNFDAKILGLDITNIRKGTGVVVPQTVADITVVAKVNIAVLKAQLNVFPLSIFVKKLPDEIYVKSSFTITINNNDSTYQTSANSLCLNGLTTAETKTFVNTFESFLGSYDDMSQSMAEMFCEVIINDNSGIGLYEIFKVFGAISCNFVDIDGVQNIEYKLM